MNNICFISWNVKGANQPTKINKIISHLQDLKGDIVFLQETHLHSGETTRIRRSRFSQLYHSKFSARARGAAILIQNNILFEAEDVIADSTGRFVIVSGTLCHTKVILASIYAPIGMMNTLSQGSSLLFPMLKHTTLSLGVISTLCKTLIWTDLPIDSTPSRSLLSYLRLLQKSWACLIHGGVNSLKKNLFLSSHMSTTPILE